MKNSKINLFAFLGMVLFSVVSINRDSKDGSVVLEGNRVYANESSSLWHRKNDDCKYTFKGKAGAKVYFLGMYVGTINAEGEFVYTATDTQTSCTAGGQEQCEARYCPINPFTTN